MSSVQSNNDNARPSHLSMDMSLTSEPDLQSPIGKQVAATNQTMEYSFDLSPRGNDTSKSHSDTGVNNVPSISSELDTSEADSQASKPSDSEPSVPSPDLTQSYNSPLNPTEKRSYSSAVSGLEVQTSKATGKQSKSDNVNKQYKFTADDLLDMETEVLKLQATKDPLQWLKAEALSMSFINQERTTTIIYVAENEALPRSMKTPALIKALTTSCQTNEVQEVLLRKNIAYLRKMGQQRVALSVKTKEDAAIMKSQPIKFGTTKFVPWVRPPQRLGSAFKPFAQATAPERKTQISKFKQQFFLTLFDTPDVSLVKFLYFAFAVNDADVTSYMSTYEDISFGIGSDTFRITFAASQRPKCLFQLDKEDHQKPINRIRIHKRTIACVGSDTPPNDVSQGFGAPRDYVELDMSKEWDIYHTLQKELQRTPTPFDLVELPREQPTSDKNNEASEVETSVPTGPPVMVKNRFDALQFDDDLNLISLQNQDTNCGELVQPIIKVNTDSEVPSPTVQYTSMNRSLNGDESDALEYHVDYISTADIANLIHGFETMDEEWIIPSDPRDPCTAEVKDELEYSLQQSNCIPLMSKIHQQPLIYQCGLAEPKNCTVAKLRKILTIHAFQRSIAYRDGLTLRTWADRAENMWGQHTISGDDLCSAIREALHTSKSTQREGYKQINAQWHNCLAAATVDLFGRMFMPQAWTDPAQMALVARAMPGVLPILAEDYHYDDTTLIRVGMAGFFTFIQSKLETWNKKTLAPLIQGVHGRLDMGPGASLVWSLNEDGSLEVSNGPLLKWSSGNDTYDELVGDLPNSI